MLHGTRRDFLADVGSGMLIASLGPALTAELGISRALAGTGGAAGMVGGAGLLTGPDTLSFGAMEPLVALMQETPPDKLLPLLVQKLAAGTELRTLVAAGALANARTFGGQDYTGYHSLMALAPAYEMSKELPEPRRALPVLKVLYRNSTRIQEKGGRENEVLHLVEAANLPPEARSGKELQEATRSADMERAERTFAALAKGPSGEAFNHLLWVVQDEVDVHRVVLAWRAWALLDLAGKEQAHTLLRQSVRYCVQAERSRLDQQGPEPGIRAVLPKLMDEHRLLEKPLGTRRLDDAALDRLAGTIWSGTREDAAAAVAGALAEGLDPESIGEALSLAANQLVLRDPGRTRAEDGKPVGSIHGASVGVHASDAANAWRNIARVSDHRNAAASLIVGAYHTAGQSGKLSKDPYPLADSLEGLAERDPRKLLSQARDAIMHNDQAAACAMVHEYGTRGQPERPVFDLLLEFATSEDGALHAEKYYRTVTEEFAAGRPVFRWRHLSALARVTASEHGYPAPGYAQARELLKV